MDDSPHIPASSQTVGPYFRIGLETLIERTPTGTHETPNMIELRGRVLDRDGAPITDAMLEFWSAVTVAGDSTENLKKNDFPAGFRRTMTDSAGSFSVFIERPAKIQLTEETVAAPHFMVLVFARGLLRHLLSRVYLGGEKSNDADPLLTQISEGRRATLIARRDENHEGQYSWDVILQGVGETVFFAW